MVEILAENLSGKAVMGSDGTELGMLYNITMDAKSGRLANLVVEPDDHVRNVDFDRDSGGRFLIPVGNVQAVKDHMIVKH